VAINSHETLTPTKKTKQNNYNDNKNRRRPNGNSFKLLWAQRTTRIITKPRTQQGKQIRRNASLTLIQDLKHKNIRQ